MANHILSKSGFIRGVQCHKSLYLNRYHSDLKDPLSPKQEAVFQRGNTIGTIARGLFPCGVDVRETAGKSVTEVIKQTRDFIENGESVIYEAGFEFEEIIVIIDIIVKDKNGWAAYEVKSSTEIKEVFRLDAAFQYYIINKSGLDINMISVVIPNKHHEGHEIEHLWNSFHIEPILDYAIAKQQFIEEEILRQKTMLGMKYFPSIAMGEHCNIPYPCDFKGYCMANPV